MSQIHYKIILSFDLGNAVDEVKEIEISMNSTLAACGVRDKVKIRSKGLSYILTCNREITDKEKVDMKKIIEKTFSGDLLGTVKVESMRKTRRQSCSQSQSR